MPSEQDNQTLERLIKAIDVVHSSPGKLFWRSFLQGLGRGLGSLVGWILLLAILIYMLQVTGIKDYFDDLINTLGQINRSVNSVQGR